MKKKYVPFLKVKEDLKNIDSKIDESSWIPDIIISINRGGCIPGVYLSHRINVPHEALDIRLRDHTAKPDLRVLEKAYYL